MKTCETCELETDDFGHVSAEDCVEELKALLAAAEVAGCDPYEDVRKMHRHFVLGESPVPQFGGAQPWVERFDCLREELDELELAINEGDLPDAADALVDLVVFAMGTAVQRGLPWQALWDDVHRANMAKVRGIGRRGHAVDLVKPPGWVGPRTAEILRAQGWEEK